MMSTLPSRFLLVGLGVLVLGGVGYAAAAHLVLPGDVHLHGQIEGADARFVRVRLGEAVYELERRSVESADLPPLDGRDALIEALLPHLGSGDARVREAAKAGLRALGPDAEPLLRAALARVRRPEVRQALVELIEGDPDASGTEPR